jgi:hypothetical protein
LALYAYSVHYKDYHLAIATIRMNHEQLPQHYQGSAQNGGSGGFFQQKKMLDGDIVT